MTIMRCNPLNITQIDRFSISCTNDIKTHFILKITNFPETNVRERGKKKSQVRLGCYIQRCARVHQVGTGDGTIADRYLPILMTSLRCWLKWHPIRCVWSPPRWPTGMLVGEPVPSPPPFHVGPEGLRVGRLVVVVPNAFCSRGKWRPHIVVL